MPDDDQQRITSITGLGGEIVDGIAVRGDVTPDTVDFLVRLSETDPLNISSATVSVDDRGNDVVTSMSFNLDSDDSGKMVEVMRRLTAAGDIETDSARGVFTAFKVLLTANGEAERAAVFARFEEECLKGCFDKPLLDGGMGR